MGTIFSLLICSNLVLYSQDSIVMPVTGNGGFYNTCYAVIYDNGLDSNYQNYSNSTVTISPLWVQTVSLFFEEFNTETYFDTLSIYDGPGTTFPKIGTYSGNSLLSQTITSTGNSITLEFLSDDIQTGTGFKAWVSCLMSNEDLLKGDLLIYPNPVVTTLYLDGIDLNLIKSISSVDLMGRVHSILPVSNSFDVSNLSSGMYVLCIQLNNGTSLFKKWIKE